MAKTNINQDLSIRGDNVQRIYTYYKQEKFIVNRKYQRKLVWNLEEKQKFIDSISKMYPVPLFLLANILFANEERFEIIDGMQRLNAINSFIEQEFGIEMDGIEHYFDLDTMAETKYLKDQDKLEQKSPMLNREVCLTIANYPLPLSIYTNKIRNEIDEIFRRINSGGRQLSAQEVRQSSSLGLFSDTVRKIAAKIRGDDTMTDILPLNEMGKVSVSNKKLNHYGIIVDDIFWVKQSIITRDKVRQSYDEEMIADLLGSLVLYPEKYTSNKDYIDNFYGIYSVDSSAQNERHVQLESKLRSDPDYWINVFLSVYDEIRKVLTETGENLNSLINVNASTSRYAPKQFLTVFLSFYELMFMDNKSVNSYSILSTKLKDMREVIKVQTGPYSGKSKRINIDAVKGVISSAFKIKSLDEDNTPIQQWITKIESILMYSYTEQYLVEFKQGFHQLDSEGKIDLGLINKVTETFTAMANHGKNSTGYIIVGIADNKETSNRISKIYGSSNYKPINYQGFLITGLNGEISRHYNGDYEKYLSVIKNKLQGQPIDQGFLLNNVKYHLVRYNGKVVLIFEIRSADTPINYGNKYFIRETNGNAEVLAKDFSKLYDKFRN